MLFCMPSLSTPIRKELINPFIYIQTLGSKSDTCKRQEAGTDLDFDLHQLDNHLLLTCLRQALLAAILALGFFPLSLPVGAPIAELNLIHQQTPIYP